MELIYINKIIVYRQKVNYESKLYEYKLIIIGGDHNSLFKSSR